MAHTVPRKKRIIRFELTPLGLFGVGVACCCLFVLLFILGIWAGQTILLPEHVFTAASINKQATATAPVAKAGSDSGQTERTLSAAEKKEPGAPYDAEASFFAIQIGAFSSEERAVRTAKSWQERGYDTFYQAPTGGGDLYWRTFLGRFNDLDEANALAEELKKKHDLKSFIALIQMSEVRIP